MTRSLPLVALTLLLASLGGCASSRVESRTGPDTAPPPAPRVEPAIGTIEYRFTSGLGGVTASAHIEPDGTMTRLKLGGERDVTMLDPAIHIELRRLIEDAQLPTLQPRYDCDDCTERPLHTVSAQLNGVTHTVTVGDSASYPEPLGVLIDRLGTLCDIAVPWD